MEVVFELTSNPVYGIVCVVMLFGLICDYRIREVFLILTQIFLPLVAVMIFMEFKAFGTCGEMFEMDWAKYSPNFIEINSEDKSVNVKIAFGFLKFTVEIYSSCLLA